MVAALAFLNVLDSLEALIEDKVRRAKSEHIAASAFKSLQKLKSLARKLQAFGAAAIEDMDSTDLDCFALALSGDVDTDIKQVLAVIMQRQLALYALDESYRSLHAGIKRLQTAKQELAGYSDTYKMRLSQLKRVGQQLASCIEENRMNRESTEQEVRSVEQKSNASDYKGSQESNASPIRRGASAFAERLTSRCGVYVFEIGSLVNQSYF